MDIKVKPQLLRFSFCLIALLLNACAHSPTVGSGNPDKIEAPALAPITDPESGISHDVYIFGKENSSKPPILLLHELPGLSSKTIEYANILSNDFTVYVPLLFGEYGQESFIKGLTSYAFNGEWNAWCFNWTPWCEKYRDKRPIVIWLGKVLDEIHANHKKQSAGVIGMCLTGAFPLALMDRDYVKAAVVAQPTLPFFEDGDANLGLLPTELHKAIDRAANKKVEVLGLRFRHDLIAKRDKHTVLKKVLQDAYVDCEIKDSEYHYADGFDPLPKSSHSTLIFSDQDKKIEPLPKPVEVRRNEVRKFLIENLTGTLKKTDVPDKQCRSRD